MRKLHKYYYNLTLILFIAGLLALPLFPYARLSAPKDEKVLGVAVSGFSDVVYSDVLEASFSASSPTVRFEGVTTVVNTSSKEKNYKIILKNLESSTPSASAYFTTTGRADTVLFPGDKTEIDVLVEGYPGLSSKTLLLILSSM